MHEQWKEYPRKFISETQSAEDGNPTYQRRSQTEGSNVATVNIQGLKTQIDNRWVVPYSTELF